MPNGATDNEYLNAGSEEQEEKSELWNAAFHGRTEKVKRLLEYRADIEEKNWEDNATALHGAAERGKKEIVQLLLDKGSNIDATQVHGYTPLSLASKRGHMAVVQLLLDNGAGIFARTSSGQTPEDLASSHGQGEVAALLSARRGAQHGAFAMGQHARLGARSLVLGLDTGVVRMILEQM